MNIVILITSLLAVGGGAFYFLKFRRGSLNQKDSLEDQVDEVVDTGAELNHEEVADVIETTFEIIEEENLQDEKFENTVTKIEQEIEAMPSDDLVDYVNSFFTTESVDHPIVCTDDKSKFEWERADYNGESPAKSDS